MNWITALRTRLIFHLQQREEQVFLLLSLLIGALTGLAVVGFIVVTERLECASTGGQRCVEACAGSCGRLNGHGLSAVPLFSQRTR